MPELTRAPVPVQTHPDPASRDVPTAIFVVHQSGSRADGGAESLTQVMAGLPTLRKLVVTQRDSPRCEEWRKLGARVVVWQAGEDHPRGKVAELVRAVRWNLCMWRLAGRVQRGVVLCNDIRSLTSTGLGARLRGTPVVFNIRGLKRPEERYGLKWRIAMRFSQRQIVLSQEMRSALLRRLDLSSTRRQRMVHIYNPVRTPSVEPLMPAARAQLEIPEGSVAIGYVGALYPLKAQDAYIGCCVPRLRSRVPNAITFFIGNEHPQHLGYLAQCRETAATLGVESAVEFVGFREDVSEWYRAVNIVVIASRREGLPRAMIESLAAGTPVVAFDVCSTQEILQDHGCGVVVPQGDYQALAEAIERLAADPELRMRMGRAGLEVANRLFDPSSVAAQYDELLRSLL